MHQRLASLAFVSALALAATAAAQTTVETPAPPAAAKPSFMAQFKDPEDGAFDMAQFLLSKHGFLVVPIVITEPAIGYGGGVSLVILKLIDWTIGLRVGEEVERDGLDLALHGETVA